MAEMEFVQWKKPLLEQQMIVQQLVETKNNQKSLINSF